MSYQPLSSSAPHYHHPHHDLSDNTDKSAPPPYDDSMMNASPHKFQAAGWRDVWWAVFFVLHLCLVIGYGAYFCYLYAGELFTLHMQSTALLSTPVLTLFACGFALSVSAAIAFLGLMRTYPAALIKFTLWLSVGMLALSLVGCIVSGSGMGILITGLLLLIQVWFVYSVQDRIAFSALILEIAVSCVQLFPATLFSAVCGIIAQSIWMIVWLVSAAAIYHAMTRNLSMQRRDEYGMYDFSDPALNSLFASLILSFYWTSMVITYVVHVTVAGVAAVWYFLYPQKTPRNPTLESFKRAMTTSFGSICLGALIIAVVKTIRAILDQIVRRRSEDENRSMIVDILFACAQCILSIIDAIISYINIYAFARIAIYGQPFFEAAQDSLSLLQRRGLDAVINDTLITGVLQFAALIGGILTAVVSYALAFFLLPSDTVYPVSFLVLASFLLGFALCMTAMETVESAVVTLFVCLAEDPHPLYATKPHIYARLIPTMLSMYPQVQLEAQPSTDAETGQAQRRPHPHHAQYYGQ